LENPLKIEIGDYLRHFLHLCRLGVFSSHLLSLQLLLCSAIYFAYFGLRLETGLKLAVYLFFELDKTLEIHGSRVTGEEITI